MPDLPKLPISKKPSSADVKISKKKSEGTVAQAGVGQDRHASIESREEELKYEGWPTKSKSKLDHVKEGFNNLVKKGRKASLSLQKQLPKMRRDSQKSPGGFELELEEEVDKTSNEEPLSDQEAKRLLADLLPPHLRPTNLDEGESGMPPPSVPGGSGMKPPPRPPGSKRKA